MRVLALFLMLLFASGLYLFFEDMKQDRQREKQIEALQVIVDGLQLKASGQVEMVEIDGLPVLRPKVIKY